MTLASVHPATSDGGQGPVRVPDASTDGVEFDQDPVHQETATTASTPPPSSRRHGLTPRMISSPAHTTMVPPAAMFSAIIWLPPGWRSHLTTVRPAQRSSGRFGTCAIVIRPVARLRNSQSTADARLLTERSNRTLAVFAPILRSPSMSGPRAP